MPAPVRLYDGQGQLLNSSQSWPAASRRSKVFDTLNDRGGLSTEADLLDRPLLQQRSAALLRGGGIAQAMVQTMLSGVVGVGLDCLPELDPGRLGLSQAEADDLEDQLRVEWQAYSTGLNFSMPEQPFAELLVDVLREALEFGDCLVVKVQDEAQPLYKSRIQLIESVRVNNQDRGTESASHNSGIHFDTVGRPTGFDIANADPNWTGAITWTRVNAEHAILMKLPRQRYGSSRGIPWLAPVMTGIHSLGEYSTNELVSSWVSTLFSLIHKSDSNHAVGYEDQAVEAGSVYRIGRDEELSSLDSDKPSRMFSDFFFSQLRVICAGVGLPSELVLKFFQSSYSASRAALLQGESTFRLYRMWMIKNLCQPLYERYIEESLRLGLVQVSAAVLGRPGALKELSRCTWLGTPMQSLDLWRAGQGLEAFDRLGILSKRRIAAEHFGVDYRRMQKERAQEGDTNNAIQ